jgi:hypothetical protein
MLDKCIVDKCKLAWDEEFIPGIANKNNCSGFVLCWGGAQSAGSKSVGEIWNRNDRDSVEYFVYGTAACPGK